MYTLVFVPPQQQQRDSPVNWLLLSSICLRLHSCPRNFGMAPMNECNGWWTKLRDCTSDTTLIKRINRLRYYCEDWTKTERMKSHAGASIRKAWGSLFDKTLDANWYPGICCTTPTTERLTRELIVAEADKNETGQSSKGYRNGPCEWV